MSTAMGSLAQELFELEADGYASETIVDNGSTVIIFARWTLPNGYNKQATRLLLRIPPSYPAGHPDMFWTDPDLRLADGSLPRQTNLEQQVLGAQWLRFSWHPSKWDPAADNLRTFLAFVDTGLLKARTL